MTNAAACSFGCSQRFYLLVAMKKSEAQYFKDLLKARLKTLEAATGDDSREIFLEEDKLLDRLDQATDEQDKQLKHRMRTRETKLIEKINLALHKIDGGTFGICEGCGGRISKQRLKARPVTTLCIKCKQTQEADEKLRGI
jgi:DnaK suppressor protein